MAVKFYNAIADVGGLIGAEVASGVKGAILPKVSSQNKLDGAIIHRKIYFETDADLTFEIGINSDGIFGLSIFESASDAEVVGDLTGSEAKYGASEITQLEDTVASTETVNGAGGLIDIKKIRVLKDPTGDVLFRASDKIIINNILAVIDTVSDQTTHWEITLVAEIIYTQCIGQHAYSMISDSLLANASKPLWLKVTVPIGSTVIEEYNTFGILVYS